MKIANDLQYSFKKTWWSKKRWEYNKGLIYAGIAAVILYAILGSFLIEPYDQE